MISKLGLRDCIGLQRSQGGVEGAGDYDPNIRVDRGRIIILLLDEI